MPTPPPATAKSDEGPIIENTNQHEDQNIMIERRHSSSSEEDEDEEDAGLLLYSMMIGHDESSSDGSDNNDENDDEHAIGLVGSKSGQQQQRISLAAGWDDSVILRCFNRAIEIHDSENIISPIVRRQGDAAVVNKEANSNDATAVVSSPRKEEEEEYEEENRWIPGDLPLPHWAVDPWYAMRYADPSNSSLSNTTSLENTHNNKKRSMEEFSSSKKICEEK